MAKVRFTGVTQSSVETPPTAKVNLFLDSADQQLKVKRDDGIVYPLGQSNVLSVNTRIGDVVLTSTDVGLNNVNNTSDANKPVSTAQATAIAVVQTDITTHKANTSNPHSTTKSQVGLGSVDNTSDVSKPISTATQAALDATNAKIFVDPTSTSQPFILFDDFISTYSTTAAGPLGFRTSIVSGSISNKTVTSTEFGKIGLLTLNSGTALSNRAALNVAGGQVSTLLGASTHTISSSAFLSLLGVAADDFRIGIGLMDDVTAAAPTNGVYFTHNRAVSATNWVVCTTKASTTTSTDTGIAISLSSSTYQNLRIEINQGATSVGFYINGSLVATHTTNIPNTVAIAPGLYTNKTVSTNAVQTTLTTDWFYWKYILTAGRGTF